MADKKKEAISQWETGHRFPSHKCRRVLAMALQVSLEDITEAARATQAEREAKLAGEVA